MCNMNECVNANRNRGDGVDNWIEGPCGENPGTLRAKVERLQAEKEIAEVQRDAARQRDNAKMVSSLEAEVEQQQKTIRLLRDVIEKIAEQNDATVDDAVIDDLCDAALKSDAPLTDRVVVDKVEIEQLRRPEDFPEIVCLCGSTRFMDAFHEAGWRLTLEGKIVLTVGVCKHAEDHGAEALGQDVADRLDELHFRKIDLADSVLILNVGGYIGESTQRELEYARAQGKQVTFLEPEAGEAVGGRDETD